MGVFLAVGTAGTLSQLSPTAGEESSSQRGSRRPSAWEGSSASSDQTPAVEPSARKASSLLGSAVKNSEGKEIGKVQDLVFDLEKGEMGYAVLSLVGDGIERNVAVPIRALKGDPAGKFIMLNMSESVLAAAESVTEGNWPASDIFAVGGPAESETGTASSERLDTAPTAQPNEAQPNVPKDSLEKD